MVSYGTPNTAYVRTWRKIPDDLAMWAVNLMRYRPRAQYPDGRATDLTGWEADDLYAPHAELAQVGAASVLRARVVRQLVGDGARWDRVAVARYPSRCAQLDMQKLPAFADRHVHKVAGMEFTIVLASFLAQGPESPAAELDAAPALLLQVVGARDASDYAAGLEASQIGVFEIEDTIVGDARKYLQARWHALSADAAATLRARPRVDDAERYVLLLEPERTHFARAAADEAPAVERPRS